MLNTGHQPSWAYNRKIRNKVMQQSVQRLPSFFGRHGKTELKVARSSASRPTAAWVKRKYEVNAPSDGSLVEGLAIPKRRVRHERWHLCASTEPLSKITVLRYQQTRRICTPCLDTQGRNVHAE